MNVDDRRAPVVQEALVGGPQIGERRDPGVLLPVGLERVHHLDHAVDAEIPCARVLEAAVTEGAVLEIERRAESHVGDLEHPDPGLESDPEPLSLVQVDLEQDNGVEVCLLYEVGVDAPPRTPREIVVVTSTHFWLYQSFWPLQTG